MPKINTEFFIARRLASKESPEGRNVMVRIAALTVAVGIAVMIISLAVINGFRSEITDKMVGFDAHVQIVNMDGNNSLETVPIRKHPQLIESMSQVKNFKAAYPFAIKGGIIKTDHAMEGVMLKGVGVDYDWSFFRKHLVEGELPQVNDSVRTKDILISKELADLLELSVEDKVEMLFVQEQQPPRRDRFKVCGIYSSGFEEMDKVFVPTDIRNVQRLNGWDSDQITGYEVTATNFDKLEQFEMDVYRVIVNTDPQDDQPLMVLSVKEKNPNLFDWLNAHNVNGAVIITIMLLVALFNMISALLIILLERTSMIGLLKSLGMKNAAVQKIFIIRSSFIILRGMLWGNIVGIGICLVQYYTHLVKLDQSGYFLSEVPIKFGWWLLTMNVGSFFVLVALLTIPTMVVSRIKPEKTIRFQ